LVRICLLNEVVRIGWRDLHILGTDECPGWEQFVAYRIGISSFFDEIVYVIEAPVCPLGTILTIGVDIAGPGGNGSAALEPSLVLAKSYPEWLRHLEENSWIEYGLAPGGIMELPISRQRSLLKYYQSLNPGIRWSDNDSLDDRKQ
jgi:hypothetical protein